MKKMFLAMLFLFLILPFSVSAEVRHGSSVYYVEVTPVSRKEGGITYSYPQVYVVGNPEATQRINKTILAVVNRQPHWQTDEDTPQVRSSYGVDHALVCNNVDNLLSFNMSFYASDPGEKPLFFYSGLTFDTQTGELMTLPKLLRREDEQYFTVESVNTLLRAKEKKGSFYLYNGTKGVDAVPDNFYLDASGQIHLQIAPYTIADPKYGVIDLATGRKTKYCQAKG